MQLSGTVKKCQIVDQVCSYQALSGIIRSWISRQPSGAIRIYQELHAHLNGSLSMKTIEKLAAMKAENDPDYCGLSEAERELLKPTERQRSLDEVFRIFPVVQNLIQHKEELTMATVDVIGDFESENVVYLELRSTPKSTKGMSKRDYVEAILDGIKFARRIHPNIVVRLILSIDRRHTLEEASDIMGMALEMGDTAAFTFLSGGILCFMSAENVSPVFLTMTCLWLIKEESLWSLFDGKAYGCVSVGSASNKVRKWKQYR
ncbi:unnamed protein product [Toxocara canis]|uniref:A_deaminase domain-containing protein n=1 Tax=Toxocara canis TaxID=6265 RepID=A0A183V3Q9_TOXCA|nr:unnamed protein product [Toxocara canis]